MNIKDGDFGYAANLALAAVLEQFDVKCQVFDKFIGEFTLNETTYVMCHGDLIFINITYLGK